MKSRLLWIGKTKHDFVKSGIGFYLKRLKPHLQLDILELELPRKKRSADPEIQKRNEAQLLLSRIKDGEYVVLFDEAGKELNSRKFAAFFEKRFFEESRSVVFVVGGAYGFHKSVLTRSDVRLSLSKLTFSHQIVRLVILEQLYRSFCILKGHPYHHD